MSTQLSNTSGSPTSSPVEMQNIPRLQLLQWSHRERRWVSDDGSSYTSPILVSEPVLGSRALFPLRKCKGRPQFGTVQGVVHDKPNFSPIRSPARRMWFNGAEWLCRVVMPARLEGKALLLDVDGKIFVVEIETCP